MKRHDLDSESGGGSVTVLLVGYRYSGRSMVLHRLETAGYICIDNLPPGLVIDYLDHGTSIPGGMRRAIVLDSTKPGAVVELLDRLDHDRRPYKLVFIDAGDTALMERMDSAEEAENEFSSEVLASVREALSPVQARADLVLDSSYMSPLEERDRIIAMAEGRRGPIETVVDIQSFGFKHGAPAGDVVVDVRFIPNPYYVASLRLLSGKDNACAEYVLKHESARGTVDSLATLVAAMVPAYTSQGRSKLKVRIGCTGGRHRSVAIVEELSKILASKGFNTIASHRELELRNT